MLHVYTIWLGQHSAGDNLIFFAHTTNNQCLTYRQSTLNCKRFIITYALNATFFTVCCCTNLCRWSSPSCSAGRTEAAQLPVFYLGESVCTCLWSDEPTGWCLCLDSNFSHGFYEITPQYRKRINNLYIQWHVIVTRALCGIIILPATHLVWNTCMDVNSYAYKPVERWFMTWNKVINHKNTCDIQLLTISMTLKHHFRSFIFYPYTNVSTWVLSKLNK